MIPRTGVALAAAMMAIAATNARAQSAGLPPDVTAVPLFVGSEAEAYFRDLQLVGVVPAYPWTLRGFSMREADSLRPRTRSHPWGSDQQLLAHPAAAECLTLLPLGIGTVVNSAFPFGYNDGAVWAGRGVTTTAQGGVMAHAGPLTVVLRPVAFWAQNAHFALKPNGNPGNLRYGDAPYAYQIDRPQAFGPNAYARLDPGESTVRLDAGPVAVGISTANEWWGPASRWPVVLGDNAPGFPHAFAGTSHPVPVGIGQLHVRAEWGTLSQSPYSSVTGPAYFVNDTFPGTRRLMAGLVAMFQPRWVPGLELGVTRFVHSSYPEGGVNVGAFIRKPFEGLFAKGLSPGLQTAATSADNQLASAYFRWVLPHSGAEVYGEYGREDHNYDLRDFVEEPDQTGGRMLGVRHATLSRDSTRMRVLRIEWIDEQATTLARHRWGQGSFYLHAPLRQGHTDLGQVLGAGGIGVGGGAGTSLGADWYRPGGRFSIDLQQMLQSDVSDYEATGVIDARARDVQYALGAQDMRTRGPFVVRSDLTLVRELNRYYTHDATNLNVGISLSWRWR